VQPNPFAGMEPDAMLRSLREEAERLESRANQLRDDLAAAGATATSPDGAVTVTLSPTGALRDVSFATKAREHTPEALGPLVMRTVRDAQRQVAAQVAESFDQSTLDAVRRFMPEPEPEQHDPGEELRRRRGRW